MAIVKYTAQTASVVLPTAAEALETDAAVLPCTAVYPKSH